MTFVLSILFMVMLPSGAVERFDTWISKNLGRPYVWGATGYKSYDCSGVVWRMLTDNGVFLKRTTARKLYMSSKALAPGEAPSFGTLVFFDDLRHMGVIIDENRFFHAQSRKGTNISEFSSFWRNRLYGYRRLPFPE